MPQIVLRPITFALTGKPSSFLLVNNPQTADRLNPWSQLIAELTGKKKRTDDEERQLQRLKWEAALYHDPGTETRPGIGPYIPGIAAWKSLLEAARLTRQGKQIERGLIPVTDKMPIEYDGPRDVEGMWESGRFVDVRDAVPAGKRVIAVRPKFVDWRVSFEAMYDAEQVNERDLKTFAEAAGRMIGLGTYRQRYGRYDVEVRV